MDFQEAEQRFQQLELQRRTQRIGDAQYRAALNGLRVTDSQGRLWMLQEGTGQWHVYNGVQWVPASPPYAVTPPPPPAPMPAPASTSGGGTSCGRFILMRTRTWPTCASPRAASASCAPRATGGWAIGW